jgi:hypothetical protein
MRRIDDDVQLWAASIGLIVAGALIAAIGFRPLGESRCRWPASAGTPASFSGADEVKEKSGTVRGGVLSWYEGSWSSGVSNGGEVIAQIVVTAALSDFLLHPISMMAGFSLETDRVRPSSLGGVEGAVPVTLRINPDSPISYVAGWIYAFEDRPVVDPAAFLVRRAFEEPLSRARPITMITAESHGGGGSVLDRIGIVTRRLEALWADWESSCRP